MNLGSKIIPGQTDQEDQSVEENEDEAHTGNKDYCKLIRALLLIFLQVCDKCI